MKKSVTTVTNGDTALQIITYPLSITISFTNGTFIQGLLVMLLWKAQIKVNNITKLALMTFYVEAKHKMTNLTTKVLMILFNYVEARHQSD